MQNISTNFAISSLSRLILGGIGLVVVGLLTRYLGPAGYGDYSAILAYLFLFIALADLGLYTILTREISRPGANESKIIGNIFTMRLLVIVGAAVLANLLTLFTPYSITVKLGIAIASAFMVLSSLAQVLMGVFQKYLKIYLVSGADLVARFIQLGLVGLLIFLRSPFLWFVAIISISEVVHFFLILRFANRLAKIRLLFDMKYWREIFKLTLPIAASLVFILIYFKLDTFLLSVLKPSQDVGIYSAAYKILEFAIFFPAAYLGLIMPLLSRYAVSDLGRLKKIFRMTFDRLAIFGWPIVFFVLVAADKLANLIGGSEFSESATVLRILSLAILIIFFGNLGGHSLVALNLQKKGMWIYLSGMILNLAGNLIFIPRYTYLAAAWTTVVTELIVTVLMFLIIKQAINTKPEGEKFFKALAASALMFLIIFPIRSYNLVFIAAVALAYWPILYLLGGFSKKDALEFLFFFKRREDSHLPD